MRRWALTTILLATTASLLGTSPAASQESTTRGILLGLHLSGGSLTIDSNQANTGGGAGIAFGYGLNRNFTLMLQGDYASIVVEDPAVDGTWALGHLDLALRFNFASTLRRWVPYLQGGFTSRVVNIQDVLTTNPLINETRFNGPAFTLGGGIMLYTNEHFALDAGLLFSGGQFTEIVVGNATVAIPEIDASSTRFNLGISWWR